MTLLEVLATAPEFVVVKLPLAGRIKGRHPGFKAPRLARKHEMTGFTIYPEAVEKAIASFADGSFHMGIPSPFYGVSSWGDEYILVHRDFHWKSKSWGLGQASSSLCCW